MYFCDEFFFREWRKLSFFHPFIIDIVGIVIPDMHIVLDEKTYIRLTCEEPYEFRQDSFPVDPFRGKQWESTCKIIATLRSKKAIIDIPRSMIDSAFTCLENPLCEIKVLIFWMLIHREQEKGNREKIRRWIRGVYSEVRNFQFL